MDWMNYERIGHRLTAKAGWGLFAFRTERRFKGSSSPPPAPDPAAIIAQQNAQIQAQTEANRVNTVGPTGTTGWSQDPTTGRWTQTVTPSAATQGLLTSAQGNAQSALDSIGKMGSLATSFANPGVPNGSVSNPGVAVSSVANPGAAVGSISNPGVPVSSVDLQTSLNLGGVPGIPGADTGVRDQVVNALYGQNTSRLDPQWTQSQTALETKLANQGVPQNSDAWNKAMDDFQRNKTDAYSTALNAAIGEGGNTMQQLFDMGLQANQTGYNEALGEGNFTNAAKLSQGDFADRAASQLFGQNLNAGQFANQAEGQTFGQGLQAGDFANHASAQDIAQQIAAGQFGNQAAGQAYGQNEGEAAFGNQAHQQTLQDFLAQVGLPNEIALPTPQGTPSTTQGVPDVLGANSLATQAGLAKYQQDQQNQAAKQGGLGSLFGTLGGAALLGPLGAK